MLGIWDKQIYTGVTVITTEFFGTQISINKISLVQVAIEIILLFYYIFLSVIEKDFCAQL